MHISPCPVKNTPLYLPFRQEATRILHLHGTGGEKGSTRGTKINKGKGKCAEEESGMFHCREFTIKDKQMHDKCASYKNEPLFNMIFKILTFICVCKGMQGECG